MKSLKKCSKCSLDLPHSSFNKDKQKRDGLTSSCKDCQKRNYTKNKDKILDRVKRYKQSNRKKIQERETKQKREKYNSDIDFRLSCVIRSASKRSVKNGQSLYHVGCSMNMLRQHIESQFLVGMSWDNYGEWHIDHIVPINWFIKNSDQPWEANHYSNLQPMWAEDNLKKVVRYEKGKNFKERGSVHRK